MYTIHTCIDMIVSDAEQTTHDDREKAGGQQQQQQNTQREKMLEKGEAMATIALHYLCILYCWILLLLLLLLSISYTFTYFILLFWQNLL